MLIEVEPKTFKHYFPSDPHPFLSEPFSELNKRKADRLVRLIENQNKPSLGLIAGVKNGVILSPFSAPFGGFHFRNETVYINNIESFIDQLRDYTVSHNLNGFEITLPPDIYHPAFNTKTISSFIRKGFQPALPEITNWIDLSKFDGHYTQRNSREYYKQAVRNKLSFHKTDNLMEQEEAYNLVKENRAKFDRPIFMSFQDILDTQKIWPVDFFRVINSEGILTASAIFYRNHPEICYAIFWGDNETGRPLRAMDYLILNLCSYYKNINFKYIDLGISTEAGIPNEGLLRFKETHEAVSSLRYKFIWKKASENH